MRLEQAGETEQHSERGGHKWRAAPGTRERPPTRGAAAAAAYGRHLTASRAGVLRAAWHRHVLESGRNLERAGAAAGGPGVVRMAVKNPQEPFTRITVQEAKEMIERGNVQFIDTRNPDEHAAGHAPGTIIIPHMSVMNRIGELDTDKDLVFICQKG